MSSKGVTPYDARTQIERLIAAGYRTPEGTSVEGLSQAWAEAHDDQDVVDLVAAVGAYLRDGNDYWPKPSQIRKRTLEARLKRPADRPSTPWSVYAAWEQHHGDGSPCPVCGAVVQICAALGGMYGVIHDAAEHNRQRVPWVGLPYSQEATAMYEAARKKAPARAPAVPMRRPDADRQIDREAWTRRQREQLDALLAQGRAPDSQAAD